MAIYRIKYEDGSATHHAEASQYLAQLYMALTGRLVEDVSDLPDAEDLARSNLTIEQEFGVWEGEQMLAAEAQAIRNGYQSAYYSNISEYVDAPWPPEKMAEYTEIPNFSALYGEAPSDRDRRSA